MPGEVLGQVLTVLVPILLPANTPRKWAAGGSSTWISVPHRKGRNGVSGAWLWFGPDDIKGRKPQNTATHLLPPQQLGCI